MVRNIVQKPFVISLLAIMVAGSVLGVINYKNKSIPKKVYYFGEKTKEFCIDKTCFTEENGWVAKTEDKKMPGDKEKLDLLAKQIGQVNLITLVSVNQNNFQAFGIVDNSPVLKSNGKDMRIGKVSQNYDATYVETDNKVYSIPFVWNSVMWGEDKYWLNKTVTNLPFYQVKKMVIRKSNKEYTVEPKDGKWPNEAQMEKAAHLVAKDIIEKIPDNIKESASVAVYTDSSQKNILLGQWNKSRKEIVYWTKDENGYFYEIDKSDFDLLTRQGK